MANDFLGAVRGRAGERDRQSAVSLLNHGEEEEAIDLLLALLVLDAVPISRSEGEAVRTLVAFFPLSRYEEGLHQYLTDPNVLDRLNVIDGAS